MDSWSRVMKPPLLRYLEERGIPLEDMVKTAVEMFVPHPNVETKEEAAKLVEEELVKALSDVNVSCLTVACFRLEEDARKGLVPGLSRERFERRPLLVTDQLLGMVIANYIAGAKGIFEFIRFDKAKPGILKRLGPIVNDAVGGLIAGASANMYSKAVSGKTRGARGT